MSSCGLLWSIQRTARSARMQARRASDRRRDVRTVQKNQRLLYD